jgi:hypothetical protein
MTSHRRILSTFDMKPTSAPTGARPDELMINWTTLPAASTASVYVPGVSADDILATAAGLNGYQPFTRIDDHTVGCHAKGITYLPIPRAPGNLAGLIDVELPATIKTGDRFTIVINQITNAQASIRSRGTAPRITPAVVALPGRGERLAWRKVAGTFNLAFKVKTRRKALPCVEQNLSILGWIFEAIPPNSRWYPIFARYLCAIAGQVTALGGDPSKIPPAGTGGLGLPGGGHKPQPGGGSQPGAPHGHHDHSLVGKIEGLVYDHFGDFEGFILENENGDRIHFFSREANVANVVRRAWAERLRVTVTAEDSNERHPRRIVLHPTPGPL